MIFQTCVALAILCASDAFVLPRHYGINKMLHMSSLAEAASKVQYTPIFDFSNDKAVESFDRIDDAIMGGISTSSIRNVPGESYASWSGKPGRRAVGERDGWHDGLATCNLLWTRWRKD
jgi:hypothetical protein